MKKKLFSLLLLFNSAFAVETQLIDPQMQIPALFNHSWMTLSAGIENTDFTTKDFQSGFDFNQQQDTIAAMRLTAGHYFNPYWALSLGLMRGIHSNEFSKPDPAIVDGVDVSGDVGKVSETLLTFTVVPTLPLKNGVSFYGEAGVAMISRNGFTIQELPVVDNANVFTGVVGGGINIELPNNWLLNFSTLYSFPVDSQQQPAIFYTAVGLGYFLTNDQRDRKMTTDYWFPLNFIEASYTNEDTVYWDVAKYFTPPTGVPIFFDGHIKVGKGFELMYERNFFHTSKNFSLEWGASAAWWQTCDLGQNFYTISIFPEMKVWMWRSSNFDLYFTYSLAGPSYISQQYLDNQDSGSHFTFQDFLGFGAFLGKNKQANISLKIVHYSNGNLIPSNPGVNVPVMFGFGLSF